jgi:hypothetical protein
LLRCRTDPLWFAWTTGKPQTSGEHAPQHDALGNLLPKPRY